MRWLMVLICDKGHFRIFTYDVKIKTLFLVISSTATIYAISRSLLQRLP